MYHPKTNGAQINIYCKTKGSEWEKYNNYAVAGKATFLLLNVCIVKQWALRFDRVNANQAAVLLPEGSSRGRGGWRCVCGQVAWAAVRVHAGTDLRCQVKAFRWSNLTVLLIESRLRAPLHSTCSKQKKKKIQATSSSSIPLVLPRDLFVKQNWLPNPPPPSLQLIMIQRIFLFPLATVPGPT